MSVLKRSSICHKSYAGSDGEIDLVKSLELLFYLSGKTYQNKIPGFIIPSAYEFLGYARSVSDEVYDKSRKTIAIIHFQNGASKSTIQKILYARPLLSPAAKHTKHLLDFLQFINADQKYITSNPMLLCISTVYYATTLYNMVQSYIETSSVRPELWNGSSITQFCTSHMPVLYSVRHAVRDGLLTFLHDSAHKSMETYMSEYVFESDALTGELATATASGLEKLVITNPLYKKQLLYPLMKALYAAGIRT